MLAEPEVDAAMATVPLIALACLLFGVGLVTSVEHGTARASAMSRAGVFMVAIGLIGLGLLITGHMR